MEIHVMTTVLNRGASRRPLQVLFTLLLCSPLFAVTNGYVVRVDTPSIYLDWGKDSGVKAGDEIVSVGGVSTQNDLITFAAAYANTKEIAKENEVDTYPMTIRSASGADARHVNIAMPPRIKSGLMDGF